MSSLAQDRLDMSRCQRIEAGDHVEKLLVNGFLPNTMKGAIQIVENVFDVLLRALHRCQAAGIFTGEGFGARLEQKYEKVFAYESRERRHHTFDDLGQSLRWPRKCGDLALPRNIQGQQSFADRFVEGAGCGVIVKEIDLCDITPLPGSL